MSDVAEAVSIGPSALYRHFRGKEELLATVVLDGLARISAVVAAAAQDDSYDLPTELATTLLEHRGVGVLWRRESRQLTAEHRARFSAVAREIVSDFSVVIRNRRSDLGEATGDIDPAGLLAWCTMAVANSVSFHSLVLPEPEFTKVLSNLIATAMNSDIGSASAATSAEATPALTQQSRREAILTAATRLFALKGFAGVSVDDIGESIGIAGPSVYNHFTSKAEILWAAVIRGDEWLRMDMNRAFAQASDPLDGLHRLLASYISFGLDNPHLIQVLVSETNYLPQPEIPRAKAAQLAYIGEWVHLVRQVHPEWDPIRARIHVQAAQSMVNDVALTPRARRQPNVGAVLRAVGSRILGIVDR